jgi:hypothetical protein
VIKKKEGTTLPENNIFPEPNGIISNQFEIILNCNVKRKDPRTIELVDSLMQQYGLRPDPAHYGSKITLVQAMNHHSGLYHLIQDGGMGSCMIDQVRFMRQCPLFAKVIFASYSPM